MIFIKNKYYNWYYGIIQNAKSQQRIKSKETYYEKHHILPRSLGGLDNTNNLILLTAREHFICHYLLCKMLPEKSIEWYSMVKALNMMKSSSISHNQNRYFNSHLYEYARKNMPVTMNNSQGGKLNSQFGTTWMVHSWIDNLRIKIPKHLIEEYIGQGWIGPKGPWTPKLSWEKIKICHCCGEHKKDCSCNINYSIQIMKGCNKYFGLRLDNLKTKEFINDWNSMKQHIKNLCDNYTVSEITKIIKHDNIGTVYSLLNRLGFSAIKK
jgi:hypothetical protein